MITLLCDEVGLDNELDDVNEFKRDCAPYFGETEIQYLRKQHRCCLTDSRGYTTDFD